MKLSLTLWINPEDRSSSWRPGNYKYFMTSNSVLLPYGRLRPHRLWGEKPPPASLQTVCTVELLSVKYPEIKLLATTSPSQRRCDYYVWSWGSRTRLWYFSLLFSLCFFPVLTLFQWTQVALERRRMGNRALVNVFPDNKRYPCCVFPT